MSEKNIKIYEEYDVAVIGGGPAGIAAAVAAARHGKKTVLIESTGCLGGTSTAGALPFYLGAMNGSVPFREMIKKKLPYSSLPRPKRAVGGIFEEICDTIKSQNGGVGPCVVAQTDKFPGLDRLGCHDEFTFDIEIGKRIFDELALDAGVHLLYYTMFLDVKTENGVVKGIYVFNKSGVIYIPIRVAIDCSGDADLVARAGFKTYKGDRKTGEMCHASLVAHIENIDSAQVEAYLNAGGDPWFYDACTAAKKKYPEKDLPDNLIIFPMVQEGVYMINGGTSFFGYDGTDGDSMTNLTIRGRQRAKVLVECLFREFFPGGENCRLRMTALYPGVRETRRIDGLYMLTENDLLNGTHFEDTIALAGRHFDLSRKSGQPFHKSNLSVKNGMTEIPYRILIPKESKNVIAAGRCVSADGQALGPARIMSTCFAMGQAAGTAAALAIDSRVDFPQLDIKELRTVLINDRAVIEY